LEDKKLSEHYVLSKLVMERAYDKMHRDFIDQVLGHFGFVNRIRLWINGCMRRAQFSVLVNGYPMGWFSSSMGLRQGCPLSHYFFIVGSEMLSAAIKKLERKGRKDHWLSAHTSCPFHFTFVICWWLLADMQGSLDERVAIQESLEAYCHMSCRKS